MVRYKKFKCQKVKDIFDSYPENIRPKMLFLRELVFKIAAHTNEVGEVEECIRWSEPSYTTPHTKSGSTIRMDWKEKTPHVYYLYFIVTIKDTTWW